MDEIEEVNLIDLEQFNNIGHLSERDKFHAAKQILFGLAVLYVITLLAFLLKPSECIRLIDVCTTTFPPLATLILASYFRNQS